MTMNQSDNQNNKNDNQRNYDAEQLALLSSLPPDFNEDDLDFAEELHTLFSPVDEELPPYYVQTLLDSENPRYSVADTVFAQKTSARVFRSLKLRRRLFPAHRSLFSSVGEALREITSRRNLLAWTAVLVLIMLCTVAFTAPSFERGMTMLLSGARGGVLRVHQYPGGVKPSSNATSESNIVPPSQISLLQAQAQLHFKIYWPESMPVNYTLSAINIYKSPANTWADGPVLELVYTMTTNGAAPKGTGEIVIREFKPLEEVLQVVQDGAAHPIGVDQYGNAQAIYVAGQWLPRVKSWLPVWSSLYRSEIISQQAGVVFWIAGDQRDGMNEQTLWPIARSMHTIAYTHPGFFRGAVATVLQADDSASGPFATDLLAIYSDDGTANPYFINMSSYKSGKLTTIKTNRHGH